MTTTPTTTDTRRLLLVINVPAEQAAEHDNPHELAQEIIGRAEGFRDGTVPGLPDLELYDAGWDLGKPSTAPPASGPGKSLALTPGTILRHEDGSSVTLTERKAPGEQDPMTGAPVPPGWWVREPAVTGGRMGLSDSIIDTGDSPWTVESMPEPELEQHQQ